MSRLSSAVALSNSAVRGSVRAPILVNSAARPSNLGRLNEHLGLSNTVKVTSAVKEYAELIGDRAVAHLANPSAYPLEDDSVEKLLVEHIKTLPSDRQKAIQQVGKNLLADTNAMRVATANGLTSATSAEELIVARYTAPTGLRGAGRVIGLHDSGGLARAADRLKIGTVKVATAAELPPRGTLGAAAVGGVRIASLEVKDVSFDTIQLVLNSIKCVESQQKKDKIFIHGVLISSEGEVKGDNESLGEFRTGDKTKTYDNRVIVSKALNPDPDVTQTFGALITLIEQDSNRLSDVLEKLSEKILKLVRILLEKLAKKRAEKKAEEEEEDASESSAVNPSGAMRALGEDPAEVPSEDDSGWGILLIEMALIAVEALLVFIVERLRDDLFGDIETDTISVNAEDGFGDDASVQVLPALRFREGQADYKVNISWRLT